MAWNFSGYEDFFCSVKGFENPLSLDVGVDPASNKGANLLSIYTGTLLIGRLLDFGSLEVEVQSSGAWSRGQLSVTIPTPGKVWTFIPFEGIPEGKSPVTYFHGGTVVLSLASIFNKNVANNAGWAVDGANLYARGNQDVGLQIEAKLAVRDSDGFLYRISYQVTALGSHNPPIQDFEGGVISQD